MFLSDLLKKIPTDIGTGYLVQMVNKLTFNTYFKKSFDYCEVTWSFFIVTIYMNIYFMNYSG